MRPVQLRAEFAGDATGETCLPIVVAEDDEAVLILHFAADAKLPPRSLLTVHAESSSDGLPIYGRQSLPLDRR